MLPLLLCLMVISVLAYFFPHLRLLVFIPLLLMIFNLIGNNFLKYTLSILNILPIISIYIAYRLPNGESKIIESRIRYQVIDFGQGDAGRSFIEATFCNQRIFLADPTEEVKWVYVPLTQVGKLWPERPFTMRDKNYTIKAKFKLNKLLLGGYGIAEVLNVKPVKGRPMITK